MPRDNSGELRTEWKISLPAALAALVELTLLDPTSSRPKYGARSALITDLLRDHVEKQGYTQGAVDANHP